MHNISTRAKSKLSTTYSRLLVDNHITDIDPEFMRDYTAEEYIRVVASSGVESAMVYACCHNGNCYYPTKVGHIHANLAGKDIFGQAVEQLKQKGILPTAYYTACWHNDSAKNNPSWRFVDVLGRSNSGRYWFSCPNNPEYRQFAKDQLAEIAAYDVAGIFIDMSFWPGICICGCCRDKYRLLSGVEIPEVLDWASPKWLNFQNAREVWIADFAKDLTAHIKSIKPQMLVTHQFSPVLLGWYLGMSKAFLDAVDYPSGDFYGGRDQHRLGAKIFESFTIQEPFEFMTSRCVNLYDHTSTKSDEEIFASAASTLAHGGVYFFIDAINPDGTLHDSFYSRLGEISAKLKPFKDKIAQAKPSLMGDIALYFSMSSNVSLEANGQTLTEIASQTSISNMDTVIKSRTMNQLLGTSVLLNKMHQPYRIVTDRTQNLSQFKTIIVNDALFMNQQEVSQLKHFVEDGGTLIVTSRSSLYDKQQGKLANFALAEVMGVDFIGFSDPMNYIVSDQEYIACNEPAVLIKSSGADILNYLAMPHYPFNDPEKYASIHSNPPGKTSNSPAITVNNFGKGRCFYIASAFLTLQQHSQQSFGLRLFQKYFDSDLHVVSSLPASVELTLLKSEQIDSTLLCLVNHQKELPNIPLRDIRITIKGLCDEPLKCLKVSNSELVKFKCSPDNLSFKLDELETVEMIEMIY